MRLKSTGGKLVYSPLSYAWSMEKTGGSFIQKYNTVLSEFVPDRKKTPCGLFPHLVITDPDGIIPTGEYTTAMVNCVWTLTLNSNGNQTQLSEGSDYEVDDSHSMKLKKNVNLGDRLHIEFVGYYKDNRRNETARFDWSKDYVTEAESNTNLLLDLRCFSKMDFSPFKNYGTNNQFPIQAQLMNGQAELTADQAVYKWQAFNTTSKSWEDIEPETCPWYVSGKDSGTIIVDVDFIQRVALHVTAWAKNGTGEKLTAATLLRRWYGQWEDSYGFAYARFLFASTRKAKAIAKITNRQGDITDPEKYFDVELFYRENANAEWKSLGNGTEFVIEREKMMGDHQIGGITRELSAYQAIQLPDGKYLADPQGNLIFGRFPTSEKEFD